jgi:hypothetical protein
MSIDPRSRSHGLISIAHIASRGTSSARAARRLRIAAPLCAALMLTLVLPTASAMAAPGELVIETVPALQGVRFELDGRPFVSGSDGRAVIAAAGPHQLKVVRSGDQSNVRISLNRWSDGVTTSTRTVNVGNGLTLQAGFDVAYLTRMDFLTPTGDGVPPSRVTSVTVHSSRGDEISISNDRPLWLDGQYVVRTPSGLDSRTVHYVILSVIVEGSNVVNRSEQQFHAGPGETWPIELLLFDATFTVEDALYGFASGNSFDLVFPDDHKEQHVLGPAGQLTLESLPRGDYEVTARGAGVALPAPLVISRPDQVVELTFLSYIDLATVVALVLLFVVAVWLLRRRRVSADARLEAEAAEEEYEEEEDDHVEEDERRPAEEGSAAVERIALVGDAQSPATVASPTENDGTQTAAPPPHEPAPAEADAHALQAHDADASESQAVARNGSSNVAETSPNRAGDASISDEERAAVDRQGDSARNAGQRDLWTAGARRSRDERRS